MLSPLRKSVVARSTAPWRRGEKYDGGVCVREQPATVSRTSKPAVKGHRWFLLTRSPGARSRLAIGPMLIAAVAAIGAVGFSSRPCPARPASATTQALPSQLVNQADLFMHYSLMGDQKLAHAYGEAILQAKPSPVELLRAFEKASNGRRISQILVDNQQNKKLRPVSTRIAALLEAGHIALARNANRIRAAILAMSRSPRAFVVSRQRLTAAGEFAVPFFIHYLNNPADKALAPYIIQMMSDIGKPLLNPLVVQLQTPVVSEKIQLVNVLGNIGYPQALPYLKQILEAPASPPALKQAARRAIAKVDPTGQFSRMSPAQLYLWLAWTYFRNEPSVAANYPAAATNPIWYYDKGLHDVTGVMVPTPIWKDIQTMRACKDALRLAPESSPAISLWLTANLQREVDLPPGQSDPTLPAHAPDAQYYAVAAGPVYLNPALTIALRRGNSRLILKIINALARTGGIRGLIGNGKLPTPLIQAMSYPDPEVRFAAAYALAAANPARAFTGAHRVTPVLAATIAQTSKPALLLVDPNAQNRNRLTAELRADFHPIASATLSQAVRKMRRVPYVALIIVPGGRPAEHLLALAASNYRLRYTPVLVTCPAARLAALHLKYVAYRTFGEIPRHANKQTVLAAYHQILARIPISHETPAKRLQHALQATHLLKLMAINRACIYSVNAALPALRLALRNSHRRVVMAAAGVLGRMENPQAQHILARAVLQGASTATAVREKLFADLAESARNVGDHLSPRQIHRLIEIVATEPHAGIRNAAAQTLGSLNVPSNQISILIRRQAH